MNCTFVTMRCFSCLLVFNSTSEEIMDCDETQKSLNVFYVNWATSLSGRTFSISLIAKKSFNHR